MLQSRGLKGFLCRRSWAVHWLSTRAERLMTRCFVGHAHFETASRAVPDLVKAFSTLDLLPLGSSGFLPSRANCFCGGYAQEGHSGLTR